MHMAVEDCTAFAAPCARRGEAVGLAIKAAGAATGPSCNLDGLRMFGRRTQELRSVALPDCLVWTPCLPKTATGKKLRMDLAKRFGIPPLQGDHAEWIVQSFDDEDNFVLKAAERFATLAPTPAHADLRCQVHDIARDVIRLELDGDSALMDVGLDSLSATTLVGRLESTFNIGLAGDEGAGAFFDAYPSVARVAEEVRRVLGQVKKTTQSAHRYLGPGRSDMEQFVVDGRDPQSLLHAAQHGRSDVIHRRCRPDGNVNPDQEVDKNGLTALHYAAGRGDLGIVVALLELSAGVDTRNKDMRTPLMWAARNGHMEVCEELVKRGADVRAANKLGICCLHWAAWGGSLDAVAFLLEKEADINSVCHAGCNVAVWAATAGSYEMCVWLHEKRADFASTNKNGHGVLNKIAWRGHGEKLAGWMLNLDGVEAQLFARDWENELPLDRARQQGHTQLAEWLHQEMCKRRPS